MVGIVQEQHPDRTRLYRQWRQLKWPILVDSFNLLGLRVVPLPVGLDASGIIRYRRMRRSQLRQFLAATYPLTRSKRAPAKLLDLRVATLRNPKSGADHFRLGVALRKRHETDERQPGDAQAAVAHWGKALALDPNQYIWRRRIQQYGPRLDKPYNFYFWVAQARKEIAARGETPVTLHNEPRGSEIAAPRRRPGGGVKIPAPDPHGRVAADRESLVIVEPLVTPAVVRPGQRVRVRISFRLNPKLGAFWNNEADGLQLSVDLPASLKVEEGQFSAKLPSQPETQELRVLEFELLIASDQPRGKIELPAYVLYDVCKKKSGVCLRRRTAFKLVLQVDPSAPTLR